MKKRLLTGMLALIMCMIGVFSMDLKANARGHFESSRIILSNELFMKDKIISPYKEKTVHNT